MKDFFSKCDQIRSFLRLHLLNKSLLKSFIFCAVLSIIDEKQIANNMNRHFVNITK